MKKGRGWKGNACNSEKKNYDGTDKVGVREEGTKKKEDEQSAREREKERRRLVCRKKPDDKKKQQRKAKNGIARRETIDEDV